MIRKKVLGVTEHSATLLVQDSATTDQYRVLRRLHVALWNKDDVESSISIYEKMKNGSKKMPHIVEIYRVLNQNGFLNVVMRYCKGGDLKSYIENSKKKICETTLCRWMLAIAEGIKELQSNCSTCLYGLEVDQVFIEEATMTEKPGSLRLRVPACKYSYFEKLEEKRKNKAFVIGQYPPEVLEQEKYDKVFTDVWYLGKVGDALFSLAHIPDGSRSPEVKHLLEQLMHKRMIHRYTIDQAIASLSTLSRKGSTDTSHDAAAPGSGSSKPLRKRCASLTSLEEVPSSLPRRLAHPNDSKEGTPARLSSSTLRGGSARRGEESPRFVTPPRKGSERMQSPSRVPNADGSWHKDMMEKMEELARLGVGTPHTGHSETRNGCSSGGRTPLSDRYTKPLDLSKDTGNVSHRYIDAVQALDINSGTTVPFHYDRENHGTMDPNTRVINQMLGENPQSRRTPERTKVARQKRPKGFTNPPFSHHQPVKGAMLVDVDTLVEKEAMRTANGKNSNEAVVETRENCVITGSPGVYIYTPIVRRQQGSAAPSESKNLVSANDSFRSADLNPSPPPSAHVTPTKPMTPPTQFGLANGGSTSTPQSARYTSSSIGMSPSKNVPSPTPAGSPFPTRERESAGLRTQGRSRSADYSTLPSHLGPSLISNEGETQLAVSKRESSRFSIDAHTGSVGGLGAIEWYIDAIRTSIRSLVRERTRYGQVMLEVAAFVRKGEDYRFSLEGNARFVRRLEMVLQLSDDATRSLATSLCSQLVALESLSRSIQETETTP